MNFKTFKSIDLLLFSLVAVIFEVINRFATVNLSSFQLIFMSFTIVLTLISMYRWGLVGMVVTIFAKFISIVISTHNKDYRFYVSYIFGTLLSVLIGYLIFQMIIGKKRIKNSILLIFYLFFDSFLAIIFISTIFTLFGENFVNNIKQLLVQECMSIFMSTIILLVANRKNGNILVEMKEYVKNVQEAKKLGNLKEIKDSPKFNSDRPYTEYNQLDDSNILDGGTLDVDQLKELSKMFENCDRINIDKPIDCLVNQKENEKKDV